MVYLYGVVTRGGVFATKKVAYDCSPMSLLPERLTDVSSISVPNSAGIGPVTCARRVAATVVRQIESLTHIHDLFPNIQSWIATHIITRFDDTQLDSRTDAKDTQLGCQTDGLCAGTKPG